MDEYAKYYERISKKSKILSSVADFSLLLDGQKSNAER